MPQCIVWFDPSRISNHKLVMLSSVLPQFVAETLSVDEPDGDLLPQHVSVHFLPFGPFDVPTHHIQVVVTANSFPKREEIKGEAKESIEAVVKKVVGDDVKSYVWINLVSGAFAEHVPQ